MKKSNQGAVVDRGSANRGKFGQGLDVRLCQTWHYQRIQEFLTLTRNENSMPVGNDNRSEFSSQKFGKPLGRKCDRSAWGNFTANAP